MSIVLLKAASSINLWLLANSEESATIINTMNI